MVRDLRVRVVVLTRLLRSGVEDGTLYARTASGADGVSRQLKVEMYQPDDFCF